MLPSAKLYTVFFAYICFLFSCNLTVLTICLPQRKAGFLCWMLRGAVSSCLRSTSKSQLVCEDVWVQAYMLYVHQSSSEVLGTRTFSVGFSALSGWIASFIVTALWLGIVPMRDTATVFQVWVEFSRSPWECRKKCFKNSLFYVQLILLQNQEAGHC